MGRKHPDKEDLQYYSLSLGGYSYREIAGIFDVSVRTAWQGVQRAKAIEDAEAKAKQAVADAVASALVRKAGEQSKPKLREPALTIDFGSSCKPLKLLTCADVHPNGPMPDGTRCMCAVCDQSGIDDHPALRRDPLTDPKLEPEPTSKPLTPDKPKDGSRKSEQWAPYASKKSNAA